MSRIETIYHKPPYIFEEVVTIDRRAYVLSGVAFKKHRRVILTEIGVLRNGRMIKDYVKRSDIKRLSKELLHYAFDIFQDYRIIKSLLVSVDDKLHDIMVRYIERHALKNPSFKLRVYNGPLGILIVRMPFSDTDIFGEDFGSLVELDLSLIKRLPRVKKLKQELDLNSEDEEDTLDNSFETMDYEDIVKEVPYDPLQRNASISVYFDNPDAMQYALFDMADKYSRLEDYVMDGDIALDYADGIETYTSSQFSIINDMLRNMDKDINVGSASVVGKSVGELANIIKNVNPLPESIWTLRALKISDKSAQKRYDKLEVGDYLVDTGFMSTSLLPFRGDEHFMRILLPKGSKVLFVEKYSSFKGEYEVILPAGSVLKMINEVDLPGGFKVKDFVYVGNIMDDVIKDYEERIQEADKQIMALYDRINPGDILNGVGLVIGKLAHKDKLLVLWDNDKYEYVMYELQTKNMIVIPNQKEVLEKVELWNGQDFVKGDVVKTYGNVGHDIIIDVYDDGYIVNDNFKSLNIRYSSKADFYDHLNFNSFGYDIAIIKNSPYVKKDDASVIKPADMSEVDAAIENGWPIMMFNRVYFRWDKIWFDVNTFSEEVFTSLYEKLRDSSKYSDMSYNIDSVFILKSSVRLVTYDDAIAMSDEYFIVEVVPGIFVLKKGYEIEDTNNRIIYLPMPIK